MGSNYRRNTDRGTEMNASRVLVSLIYFLFATFSCVGLASGFSLELNGIRNSEGNILIAIHDSKIGFENADLSRAYAAFQIRANTGKIELVIRSVPKGSYAIAVHHDEDGDKEIDTGLILAKEGYAFSNGTSCFSIPSFEDSVFDFNKEIRLLIEIKYC